MLSTATPDALPPPSHALTTVAQTHGKRLLRTCIRITKDYAAAEDCFQTSLALAIENYSQCRSHENLAAWLNRIVVNTAIAHVRCRNMRTRAEVPVDACGDNRDFVPVPDHTFDPETECYRRELSRAMHCELSRLPEKLRAVVVLRDFEQIDTSGTAGRLGISAQAVRSRLFRARRIMRRRLAFLRTRSDQRGPGSA